MKKIFILFSFLILIIFLNDKAQSQLLSGYNSTFYSSGVFDAAEGIAMPFLLQQGFKTMAGVTIHNDSMISYNGQLYTLVNFYQNPGSSNGYYVPLSQYSHYGIDIFRNVWHKQFPNILYNPSNFTFTSNVDCVGYGTRLLSSVGDSSLIGNAYRKLITMIKAGNTTPIAEEGFVASAYQFGAAFATLPDGNPGSWAYVSGNIIADSINSYNHRVRPTLGQYNGRIKGGYQQSFPGDILAFSYGPGSKSNGHFMVMTSVPYQLGFDTLRHFYPNVPDNAINNFLSTYKVYATPVYDCSGEYAHFHDSRNFTSGIGHGTLWVITNSTGVPQGFIFKEPSDTTTTIRAQMLSGDHTWAITVGRYDDISSIGNGSGSIPSTHKLSQNYPNPFNPETNIKFQIPKSGIVTLRIFDMNGRELETLVNQKLNPGSYELNWNASSFPSGVYFYKLMTPDFSETKKMILAK